MTVVREENQKNEDNVIYLSHYRTETLDVKEIIEADENSEKPSRKYRAPFSFDMIIALIVLAFGAYYIAWGLLLLAL